jgi:TolB-like protein/Tfp pilus assembly protein PilF
MQRRELRRGGILCPIEPQVCDLLQFLIENRERVVSRDEIFRAVWRGRIVSDSVLASRISTARAAIGDDGVQQRLIRTFRRNGFRFIGDVVENGIPADSPITVSSPKHRLAFALKDAPAIVVLPFKCGSESGKDAAFAETLTDEIICALYKFDWLLVVSQYASFSYEGPTHKLRQVAKSLGARYLLQGSVRQELEHNGVRVVVRLVNDAGNHLWAEPFDCNLDLAFLSQTGIAAKVAAAVANSIFAAESIRTKYKSPKVSTSWDPVIGAVTLIGARKKQQVAAARALLNKAIDIDPKCAPAYALLSFVSTLGVHLGWHSRKVIQPSAIDAAEHALALDGEDAWAHLALGYAKLQLANRPDEAIEILQNALALNPNLAMAHYFIALASCYLGRPENAFKHADLAERLESYDLLKRGNAGAINNVRATASFAAGRYRQGIEFGRKAISQNPGQVPAYRSLVINGALAGEIDQAVAALKTVKRLAPNVQKFIDESESIWAHRENYKKYVEAFHVAGLR